MGTVLTTEETLESRERQLERETSLLGTVVYLEIAAGVSLAGYGVYRYLTTGTMLWPIVGGICLYFALAHYYKRRKNRDDRGKIQSGRSGETFVAGLLEDELPDDYYILNDLTVETGSESAQNDHVVVSTDGLFLVETKAYAGHLTGDAGDDYWTQQKNDESNPVTNPIQQSLYHARILNRFLSRRDLPFDPGDVHWHVAMVNKECSWDIGGDDSRVDYAWKIPGRIRRQSAASPYDSDDVRTLLRELNVTVPDELQ